MVEAFWTSFLDLETPAGRMLRRLAALLPQGPEFTITVFGSAPLQIAVDPTLTSADVDVFSDFEAQGTAGKSKFMDAGESENSCAKWLSATPSFFTIEPGQTKKIQVLLQVPNSPDANRVKWSAMRIKLAKEKVAPSSTDHSSIGLGVSETFQFVVHIFQTPPTVSQLPQLER